MNLTKLIQVLLLGLAACLCVRANPKVTKALAETEPNSSSKGTWMALVDDKQVLCAAQLEQMGSLTLDKVTEIFEKALDHMVKACDYMSEIAPHIKQEAADGFYCSGAGLIREISDHRRQLIDDYREAEKSGAEEKVLGAILEKYFYKACMSKLGTHLTEHSLSNTAQKLEELKKRRGKLH